MFKKIQNNLDKLILRIKLDKKEIKKKHWSDDWDKAKYTINKYSNDNDNGDCKYLVFRTLNGETEQVSHWLGHETKKEALEKVDDDKSFYEEEWNRINTQKVEVIDVDSESLSNKNIVRIKVIYIKNLKMTEGKIAAQVAHAVKNLGQTPVDCNIVVLGVSRKKFSELIKENKCYIQKDKGLTEVKEGTETAAAWIENE